MITRDHVVLTVFGMRLLALAGVLLMARYLPRLAIAHGVDPRGALWLGLLNPLVLAHFVAGGHNDALMLGLVIAGVTIAIEATDQRWVAAGVVITSCAVLVKAPALLAVGFLAVIWARRLTGRAVLLRASLRVGAVALGTAALITLASGLGFGWVRQLNTPGQVVTWLSIPTGLGLVTDLVRGAHNFITSEDTVISVFRIVFQAITVLVVFWLWLRAGRFGVVAALAMALLALVLLGPVVQPWYVVWSIALAATVRLPHRVWLLAAAASVWLAMMITPQGENLFLEIAPTLATGLAGAVAAYAVLSHERGRPPLTEPALAPALPDPLDTGPFATGPFATGSLPAGLLVEAVAIDRIGEAVLDPAGGQPLPAVGSGG
jgi:hypothetical protein